MGTIKICDRQSCGGGIDNDFQIVITDEGREKVTVDLCNKCLSDFNDWMNKEQEDIEGVETPIERVSQQFLGKLFNRLTKDM